LAQRSFVRFMGEGARHRKPARAEQEPRVGVLGPATIWEEIKWPNMKKK
jgi:hypothetical protein